MVRVLPLSPTPTVNSIQTHGVTGKLSVPVDPESVIYAHFRHIIGVTAGNGMEAIPLFKLHILDNLIENYLKAQKPNGLRSEEIQVPVSARTVDTTIAALSADLREAMLAGAGSAGAPTPPTGILLTLSA